MAVNAPVANAPATPIAPPANTPKPGPGRPKTNGNAPGPNGEKKKQQQMDKRLSMIALPKFTAEQVRKISKATTLDTKFIYAAAVANFASLPVDEQVNKSIEALKAYAVYVPPADDTPSA